MFEFAILIAICCIATAASLAVYQRRQDVLYGSFIEDAAGRSTGRHDGADAGPA
ncbi:hypothetical protein ACQR1I_35350 [Bradyrhizobium sp. HKCCYLS2038]|uniref:hypothetical protein n=1 Tax=unclassified Bradyrhizobium TaxID=2631580 RepID=UPI003EB9C510